GNRTANWQPQRVAHNRSSATKVATFAPRPKRPCMPPTRTGSPFRRRTPATNCCRSNPPPSGTPRHLMPPFEIGGPHLLVGQELRARPCHQDFPIRQDI